MIKPAGDIFSFRERPTLAAVGPRTGHFFSSCVFVTLVSCKCVVCFTGFYPTHLSIYQLFVQYRPVCWSVILNLTACSRQVQNNRPVYPYVHKPPCLVIAVAGTVNIVQGGVKRMFVFTYRSFIWIASVIVVRAIHVVTDGWQFLFSSLCGGLCDQCLDNMPFYY